MHDPVGLPSSSQRDNVRCFMAVPMDGFRHTIEKTIHRLQEQFLNVKWVDPNHTHITLHFFGQIPRGDVTELVKSIAPIVQKSPPFRVSIREVGFFPNPFKPHIVWLGVSGETAKIITLQAEIENCLRVQGYPTEDRTFVPHITIGRCQKHKVVKRIGSDKNESDAIFQSEPEQLIRHLILFESILTPQGAKYVPLETLHLSEE